MNRNTAERIVNNNNICEIHRVPMKEYGAPDDCGTRPTRCEECLGGDSIESSVDEFLQERGLAYDDQICRVIGEFHIWRSSQPKPKDFLGAD